MIVSRDDLKVLSSHYNQKTFRDWMRYIHYDVNNKIAFVINSAGSGMCFIKYGAVEAPTAQNPKVLSVDLEKLQAFFDGKEQQVDIETLLCDLSATLINIKKVYNTIYKLFINPCLSILYGNALDRTAAKHPFFDINLVKTNLMCFKTLNCEQTVNLNLVSTVESPDDKLMLYSKRGNDTVFNLAACCEQGRSR